MGQRAASPLSLPGEPWQRLAHALDANVELWTVDLDAYARTTRLDGLGAAELTRAARMHAARDGQRFLASRHALRRLLAHTLGCDAGEVALGTDSRGKPVVLGAPLHFSLSRSGGQALIGTSRTAPVGVDLEQVRSVPDAAALVREHFTAEEREHYGTAPPDARDRRFLECWTRKEACVKAVGVGVAAPFAAVATGDAAGDRTVPIAMDGATVRVRVSSLEAVGDRVGALAVVDKDVNRSAPAASLHPTARGASLSR